LEDAGTNATLHNNTKLCLDCGAGKYSDVVGLATCHNCGKGKFNEGAGVKDAESSCVNCPLGKWSDVLGLAQASGCQNCPPGTYLDSIGTGEGSCKNCGSGKYNAIDGSESESTCQSCQAGKYRSELPASSASDCLDCPVGKYSSEPGFGECSLCGQGKYMDDTGAASMNSCKLCPAGTRSASMGATNITNCIDCEAGKWSDVAGYAGACTDCVKGYYNELTGSNSNSSCVACPKGTIGTETGQVSASLCTSCPLGRFSDELAFAGEKCDKCGMGSYNDETGQPNCKKCPLGSLGTELGQVAIEYCKVCPVGEFSTNSSLPTCSLCEKGKTTAKNKSSNHTHSNFHNSSNDCSFAAEGWWLDSDVHQECSNQEIACGGYNTCTEGYSGKMCAGCADHFFRGTNGACFSCPANDPMAFLPHLTILGLVFLAVMVVSLNLCKLRTLIGNFVKKKTSKSLKIIFITLHKNHRKSIKSKGKILFSFFQVVSLMSRVYSITYPVKYVAFLENMFSWVGLNIITEIECYQKVSYLFKLKVAVFGPLGMVGTIFAFSFLSTLSTQNVEKKKERMNIAISLFLVITFAVLPSVSLVAFRSFVCDDETNTLNADPMVVCDADLSPEYATVRVVGRLGVIIWPILVPLVYLKVSER